MPSVAAGPSEIVLSFEHVPEIPASEGPPAVEAVPAWVHMWDNHCVAWIVPDTDFTQPPTPVIIGGMVPAPPDTAPVISPQWASLRGSTVIVPNLWRGTLNEFFTWLATNNDAHKLLRGDFSTPDVSNAFALWSQQNPTLVYGYEAPVVEIGTYRV